MKRNILLILSGYVFLIVLISFLLPDVHRCYWEDCPHYGTILSQDNFTSKWSDGYEEGTDGYYVEFIHFMNPDWTYEQCEDYVLSGVE